MDELATRIKALVLVLYPTILSDLSISDGQLNFFVQDVIDRALVYMNRDQLVYQYELDLVNYPQDNSAYDAFWACYEYPVPPRVESTLAKTVVGVAKNAKEGNTAVTGAITRVKDQGQEVDYASVITNYLASSSESEVFSGSLSLLTRYLLPTIVKNVDSEFVRERY